MADAAAIRAEAERLWAIFEAEGARPVEADVLQPAETLLDLYGEDVRARAFVTDDPLRGEMILRPDFTVPVVQMHLASGAAAGRYVYSGTVFRQQPTGSERAAEYTQVGYEVFGGASPAEEDAAVFALFLDVLAPFGLRAATGDIGLLRAVVLGLSTSEARKAALLRHLWRPRRFRALLDRFSGRTPIPAARHALLAEADPIGPGMTEVGLRSRAEVEARLETLRKDAADPPIDPAELQLLEDLLALRSTCAEALKRLGAHAGKMPSLAPAVERFTARLEALRGHGVAPEALLFEASYGRTTLEYYDGFVFGFYAEGRDDLPPVATGGRYDALTEVLGRGRGTAAVGGVIRPGLTAELRGAA